MFRCEFITEDVWEDLQRSSRRFWAIWGIGISIMVTLLLFALVSGVSEAQARGTSMATFSTPAQIAVMGGALNNGPSAAELKQRQQFRETAQAAHSAQPEVCAGWRAGDFSKSSSSMAGTALFVVFVLLLLIGISYIVMGIREEIISHERAVFTGMPKRPRDAGTGSPGAIMYCGLEIADEAGDVCGKLKKHWRDGVLDVDAVAKELGDVLYPLARLCDELGLHLQDVMDLNVDKLHSRNMRGTLQGSGDDR